MWKVDYHSLVIEIDLKEIHRHDQKHILDTSDERLGKDPYAYGEPLKGDYKGYWRMRVGIYRVIYKIIKDDVVVVVIKIGRRKDDLVYQELAARLHKIQRRNS
jgi:mRNA interferase RelE/StbE